MGLNVTIILYSKKGNKSMKAKEVRCNLGFWDAEDALELIKSIYVNPVPVKAEDFEEMETETETVSRGHKRGRAYRRNERNKHIAKRKRESDSIFYDGHGVYKFDGQLDKGNGIAGGKYRPRHGWKTTNTPMTAMEMKLAAWDRADRREKETKVPEPFYGNAELKHLYNTLYDLDDRRWRLEKEKERIEQAIDDILYDMMDVEYNIRKIEEGR